jgi:hypothetical protein
VYSFWETLPNGLQVLKVTLLSEGFGRNDPQLHISILSKLPRSLDTIKLKGFDISGDGDDAMAVVFPKNLIQLTLYRLETMKVLANLPPILEHFRSSMRIITSEFVEVPVSSLPRTLKSLYASDSDVKLTHDGPFPPQLELLNCPISNFTFETILPSLPPSITNLGRGLLPDEHTNLRAHFPKLKEFTWSRRRLDKSSFLETLPLGLTSLNITIVNPFIVPWADLPASLEILVVPITHNTDFASFRAQNLKKLVSASFSGQRLELTLEQWKHCPASLKYLLVQAELFPTTDCLEHLQNLEILHIISHREKPLLLNDRCKSFSRNLIEIDVTSYGTFEMDWIPTLAQRCKKLRSLGYHSNEASCVTPAEELPAYFASFPESLTTLTLTYLKDSPNNILWRLPAGLQSLTILRMPAPHPAEEDIDKYFQHLPANLRSLSVMGSFDKLIAAWPHLPPNIVSLPRPFLMTSESYIRLYTEYYQHPKWQGIVKPLDHYAFMPPTR